MQTMTEKGQHLKGGRQSSNVQRVEPVPCREIPTDPGRFQDEVIYLGVE